MRIKTTPFGSNPFKRSVAIIAVALFLLTSLSNYAPAAFAQYSNNIQVPGGNPSGLLRLAHDREIRIPPELGSIDEVYRVPRDSHLGTRQTRNQNEPLVPSPESRHDRMVVYIQDAHDSLEAQENIAKIINHLVANDGVKTVFEEGYEGPVPTDKYFGFIKDPKIKEKVSYFLMDHLRVGGAEYAHINRTKDFNLVGADSLKLHKENVDQYRFSAGKKDAITKDLKALEKELKSLADSRFPKELKEWLKTQRQFDSKKLDLFTYLGRTMPLLGEHGAEKGLGLIRFILEAIRSNDPVVIEKAKHIDAREVFSELIKLEQAVSETYLHDPADKQLFEYYKILDLLNRLNDLQVSQEEYESVKASLKAFDTDSFARFIFSQAPKTLILSRMWERNIKDAIRFYEIAQERDHSLSKVLEGYSEGENKKEELPPKTDMSVLVFGGFHKESIKRILEAKGFSYLVVSPRITKPSPRHEEFYQQLMTKGMYKFEVPLNLRFASRALTVFAFVNGGDEVRTIEKVIEHGVKPAMVERHLFDAPENIPTARSEIRPTRQIAAEGASGDILAPVVQLLRQKQEKVIPLFRAQASVTSYESRTGDKLQPPDYFMSPLYDRAAKERMIRESDTYYQFGGPSGVGGLRSEEIVAAHALGPIQTFRVAENVNPEIRLIYASSRMVYGLLNETGEIVNPDVKTWIEHVLNFIENSDNGFDEVTGEIAMLDFSRALLKAYPVPANVATYDLSKLLSEAWLKRSLRQKKLTNFIAVRISSSYGPGSLSGRAIQKLIEAKLDGKNVKSHDEDRDYLYVGDMAEALVKAGEVPYTGSHFEDLASGILASPREIVEIIDAYMATAYPIATGTIELPSTTKRQTPLQDPSWTRQLLNRDFISLADGIRHQVDFHAGRRARSEMRNETPKAGSGEGAPGFELSEATAQNETFKREFNAWLKRAWADGLQKKKVVHDPSLGEVIDRGDLSVRLLERRAQRPGGAAKSSAHQFGEEHNAKTCVFCASKFKEESVIIPLTINGHAYDLTYNQSPIGERHFMLTKRGESSDLRQFIHDAGEIKDMLTLQRHLDSDFIQYLNCLAGEDGSDGAATINHWHSQFLPRRKGGFHFDLLDLPKFDRLTAHSEDIRIGTLRGGRLGSRVFEGQDMDRISEYAFSYLAYLNERRIAYNIMALIMENGVSRIVIIPRKRGIPLQAFKGQTPVQRFGPSELHGQYVEAAPEAFAAMKAAAPREVEEMLLARTSEVGFSEPELDIFDHEFVSRYTPRDDKERAAADTVLAGQPDTKLVMQRDGVGLLYNTARIDRITSKFLLINNPIIALPAMLARAWMLVDGKRSLFQIHRMLDAISPGQISLDFLAHVFVQLGGLGYLQNGWDPIPSLVTGNYPKESWDLNVASIQYAAQHTAAPLYVLLEITNRCTRNCRTCYLMTSGAIEKDLDDQAFLEGVVEPIIASGAPYVTILGGEPLERKDLLLETLRRLKAHHIYTKVISNGDLFTPAVVRELEATGLNKIEISVDGFNAGVNDLIRGSGAFAKIEDALQLLQDSSIPELGISVTVSSANFHEILADLSGFLKKYPKITKVYFSRFFKHSQSLYAGEEITPDQIQQLKEAIQNWQREFQPSRPRFEAVILDLGKYSCGRSMVVVTPSGKLKPCPFFHGAGESLTKKRNLLALWHESFGALRSLANNICFTRLMRDNDMRNTLHAGLSLESLRLYFKSLEAAAKAKDTFSVKLFVREADGKVSEEEVKLPLNRLESERHNLALYLAIMINIRGILVGATHVGMTVSHPEVLRSGVLLDEVHQVLASKFGETLQTIAFGKSPEFIPGQLKPDVPKPVPADASPEPRAHFFERGESLGFDIGGTNLKSVFIRDGKILWQETIPEAQIRGSVGEFIEGKIAFIQREFHTNLTHQPMYVTIPGPVTPDKDIIRLTFLEQTKLGTTASLESLRRKHPNIHFENDANTAAFYQTVKNRIAGNMILNTLGTGIGLGIIKGGRLIPGPQEAHFRIKLDDNAVYHEGFKMRGDIESYANAGFVIRRARELATEQEMELPGELTPKTVASWLSDKTDHRYSKIAQQVFDEFGRNLSILYSEIARVTGIRKWIVVLVGGIAEGLTGKRIIAGVRAAVFQREPDLSLDIKIGQDTDYSGALGAAYLGLQMQHTFSKRAPTLPGRHPARSEVRTILGSEKPRSFMDSTLPGNVFFAIDAKTLENLSAGTGARSEARNKLWDELLILKKIYGKALKIFVTGDVTGKAEDRVRELSSLGGQVFTGAAALQIPGNANVIYFTGDIEANLQLLPEKLRRRVRAVFSGLRAADFIAAVRLASSSSLLEEVSAKTRNIRQFITDRLGFDPVGDLKMLLDAFVVISRAA